MRAVATPMLLALGAALVSASARAATDEGVARPLVTTAGSSAMPSWSPDGARILFHSRRKDDKQRAGATRNLYSVRADGTDERRLTKGNKDEYHAVLSPDGKKILYVSEVNGSRDIWLADADGQNAVPLTDDPGTEDQPAWAPDSRQIAYAAFPKEGGSFDLWLMYSDGSGRRRLTATPANEIFPTWHPNGDLVAYVTDAGGNFDIYAINIHDGRTTPIVVSPDNEARPAWSPDGTKIAFSRWPARGRSTESTLWVANADGTAPIELSAAPAPATHPAWAPDGRTLAFQHRGETAWEIWSLALPPDIVGGARLRLAQQVRGGADVDTVKLRGGDTLRGLVKEPELRMRAAYGAVDLPRTTLATVVVGASDRGLTRVVLANGDTLTGFLETSEIHLAAGPRTETVAVERIAELSFRAAGDSAAVDGRFRAVMRNGDSVIVRDSFGPLHLKVGGRPVDTDARQIERVEFAESGDKATVVLVSGDSLSGELAGGRLELVLALGPKLAVDPSAVRSLGRIGQPVTTRAGS
jgi:dipeptidyl aminopeptidase/acylaminoacyl peptidase